MADAGPGAKADAPRRSAPVAAGRGALLLLALVACAPPALEVGPVAYSTEEVGLLSEPQRELLADLTALGLLAAGDRLGEVAEPFLERELRSLMLQRLAMEVAVQEAGMDDAALRAAYARAPEPELVVRHLVVVSERWRPDPHRDSARARAEEALARARRGASFEALAAEYSDEPGAAERGGLLQPGRKGRWAPEFWAAAEDLRPGEVSDVVETEFGFHVLRLEERRAVPFEEVRHEVLERFVDLPAALSRAQEWAAGQADEMRVDTVAVEAWRQGDAEPGDALVTWRTEAGPSAFTAGDLRSYAATLPSSPRPGAGPPDRATALALAESGARSRLLVERARRRDLEPSIAQRAALERRWTGRLERLAEAFGFASGMRPRTVKEAALEALGAEGQELAIARRELETFSRVLRMLVPVGTPATAEETAGAGQSSSSADVVKSDTRA